MGVSRHGIRLVKDNHFERWIRVFLVVVIDIHFVLIIIIIIIVVGRLVFLRLKKGVDAPLRIGVAAPYGQTGKMLDLVPDNRNPALVTCIEFQDASTPLRWVPKLPT